MLRGYVIVRDDGQYVARPGSEHSYCGNLQDAKVFWTLAEAERNRCPENERTVSLEDIFARR